MAEFQISCAVGRKLLKEQTIAGVKTNIKMGKE